MLEKLRLVESRYLELENMSGRPDFYDDPKKAAALLKEQAAELGAAMANGVRVVFGSKDAVEAAKELFDTVETL